MSETSYRTHQFDEKLLKVEHFTNHPQMIPFVGSSYFINNPRLLIIAESHYVKDLSDDLITNWYKIKSGVLNKDQRGWTSTSDIVNGSKMKNKYPEKGHTIFKNIEDAIIATGLKPDYNDNMLKFISYMNFFQRPATKRGESINASDHDKKIANQTVSKVIEILEPDFIFFVSSKAWSAFEKNLFKKPIVGHSCHPTCNWWNRKSKSYTNPFKKKSVTGKESFMDFIIKNEIFKLK